MKPFSRYNMLFGGLALPPLIMIALLTLFAEPVTGDLTRLGGYLEEDFGWNEAQIEYAQSNFKLAKSLDDYDGYYDVIVLGDSFSTDALKGWENRFVERTGLSVLVFSMTKPSTEGFAPEGIEIESILNSQEFRSHPPKYFIFQSVERHILERLLNYADKPALSGEGKDTNGARSILEPLTLPERKISPTREVMRYASPSFEVKIQEAINYIAKGYDRLVGDNFKARVFELNRNDLFSSGRPDRLLVYEEDTKKNISGDAIERAARGLREVEKLVEKNGVTHFWLVLFPDKLTVYAPYFKQQKLAVPSYLPALSTYYRFPRLDIAFQQELEKGVKDLYLPDDTHTGYRGFRVAADRLIDFYLMGSGGVKQ